MFIAQGFNIIIDDILGRWDGQIPRYDPFGLPEITHVRGHLHPLFIENLINIYGHLENLSAML